MFNIILKRKLEDFYSSTEFMTLFMVLATSVSNGNLKLLLDFLSTVLTRDVVSCISIGIDEIEYEIAEYDDEFAVEYEIVEDDDKLAAEDEDEINDDDEIVTVGDE
ncbi:unnamed protein product, partial [Rotaria socialis]